MSGSLSHIPERIVRQLLIDLGLGSDPDDEASWPTYYNAAPDSDDTVVIVRGTAGDVLGTLQPSGERCENYGIQITVRGQNTDTPGEKAWTIATTLDGIAKVTVLVYDRSGTGSSSYLVHGANRISGPINLGKEPGTKRHLFTINFKLAITQL